MNLSSVNPNPMVGGVMPQKNAGQDADLQALKKQLQQLQAEKQKAVQRKDEKEKEKLEKQIEEIQKQIQQLRGQNQKEAKAASSAAPEKTGDTFERQAPQQTAGVYQISRDENGRPVVQTDKNPQDGQSPANENPEQQGEKPVIMKTTGNTDQVDREIEKLKQTQTQTEQKIAAAKDEKEKQALQKELEQVKAELRRKDNDTYRRQHMQITEQKVVSRIGE